MTQQIKNGLQIPVAHIRRIRQKDEIGKKYENLCSWLTRLAQKRKGNTLTERQYSQRVSNFDNYHQNIDELKQLRVVKALTEPPKKELVEARRNRKLIRMSLPQSIDQLSYSQINDLPRSARMKSNFQTTPRLQTQRTTSIPNIFQTQDYRQ